VIFTSNVKAVQKTEKFTSRTGEFYSLWIEVHAELTSGERAFSTWQQQTYQRLVEAYQARVQKYIASGQKGMPTIDALNRE